MVGWWVLTHFKVSLQLQLRLSWAVTITVYGQDSAPGVSLRHQRIRCLDYINIFIKELLIIIILVLVAILIAIRVLILLIHWIVEKLHWPWYYFLPLWNMFNFHVYNITTWPITPEYSCLSVNIVTLQTAENYTFQYSHCETKQSFPGFPQIQVDDLADCLFLWHCLF